MLEMVKLNVHWKILNELDVKAFLLKLSRRKYRLLAKRKDCFLIGYQFSSSVVVTKCLVQDFVESKVWAQQYSWKIRRMKSWL